MESFDCCQGAPCGACQPARSDAYVGESDTASRYYPVDQILNFVAKTIGHGAPESVALKRAESKFKVDRKIIRSFWRGLQ